MNNMKIAKKIIAISLLLVSLVAFVTTKIATKAFEPEPNSNISIKFTQGSLPTENSELVLFDPIIIDGYINISNCLTVPGVDFATITDSKLNSSISQLDCETFMFDVDGWYYTFTGWHIVGTDTYLPAKTVYQAGDIVLESVLEEHVELDGENYTLTLEALWGKCYFIKNAYSNVIYSKNHTDYYEVDHELSLDASKQSVPLSSDANSGRTPELSKASIDGLFETFRKNVYVDKTQDRNNAYQTVVMLAGDLNYAKDTDSKTLSNIYGQKVSNTAQATIAVTYKSLQTTKGNVYSLHYKPKSYYNTIYGNVRYDNINLVKLADKSLGAQTTQTEFMLHEYITSEYSYFETTARYNSKIPSGKSHSIYTFRPHSRDLVVLNGGAFGTFQTSWNVVINTPNDTIEWYFGRNASVSKINCGTTANYESTNHTLNVNFKLVVTGGKITDIYGGSCGRNSKTIGNREILIMGDGNPSITYNPQITNIYGGAQYSKLWGDINLTINNCSKITNIYGGGDAYTATTYGDIHINILNSLISGDLYGGGKNANSEKDPNTGHGGDIYINVDNSAILGNIYGSGMGMTQTLSIADTIKDYPESTKWFDTTLYPDGLYPEDWDLPFGYDSSGELDPTYVNYYPKYEEETGYVLIGGYKTISWTENSRKSINFKYNYEYAYLSLATVENVDININESTIGQPSSSKGNIYGGGSIAQVLGDTNITISGASTTIYGSVYGGGDGVSIPGTVTVYKPLDKATYVTPRYTVSYTSDGSIVCTLTNQTPSFSTSTYGVFTWSNDTSLLSRETKGIDLENKLLYSPNTIGLGKVVGNTHVTINGGTIKREVYGGGNKGQVDGNTYVYLNGDAIIPTVYGGCNQADVLGSSNVIVNTNTNTINYVYGGNNVTGNVKEVNVTVLSGIITNLYGGGSLAHDDYTTNITVENGSIANLYGGGRLASVGNINMKLESPTIENVYGGGDQGNTLGNILIDLTNNPTIVNLFGGANQADVNGNINIDIDNATVTHLYGGNNLSGNISGTVNIQTNLANPVDPLQVVKVTNLYGGGNEAMGSYNSFITINYGQITNLYGGGKNANINNSQIVVNNGTFDYIYGGGFAGDVNKANITINNATINQSIYGGGFEGDVLDSAIITFVNGTVDKDFVGGGYAGSVANDTNVTIQNGNIEGNLYGGGYNGDVLGNSTIIIDNANIKKNVYGGGFSGDILGNSSLVISNGNFESSIYGGGYAGHIGADSTISFHGGTVSSNIYGGGYEGNITNDTNISITGGNILNNVYGGGFAGDAQNTNVIIRDTDSLIKIYGNVFGAGEGESATVYDSTDVLVDLKLTLSATETAFSTEELSGKSKVEYSIAEAQYSTIVGNVYGGGDLGQVGVGIIDSVNNVADVSTHGTSNVVISNGYIGGSVYGGGSGVPLDGQRYEITMGTIFGNTVTTINGGYIGGSVYGGGKQSRLFEPKNYDGLVAQLNVTETTKTIVISGSVFGGGERGNGSKMNASVPTTTGDVKVTISGILNQPSQIYFVNGGVYGDGNLCLVNGYREIVIENFNTSGGNLKTFFSLQRADHVDVINSAFVLIGAIDLVEEGDDTVYSINRISKISMKNGSTIKLDQIVKYLGQIESDYQTDRIFTIPNNLPSNDPLYSMLNPLTDEEINDYITNVNITKNIICVANGLYLDIISENTNKYGIVKGLFTLQLLIPAVGEGGGFVYANDLLSTGDFICETLMKISSGEGSYVYMPVIDNYGGESLSNGHQHYWYIQGEIINYVVNIDGYIGSEVVSYENQTIVPGHSSELIYALNRIVPNAELTNAVTGANKQYDLVPKNTDLKDQEIAIELRLKGMSWFLVYEDDAWGVKTADAVIHGYENTVTEIKNNILASNVVLDQEEDQRLTIILHKSTEVNAELKGLKVLVEINLYTYSDGTYNEYNGTNKLHYNLNLAIVRLVPVQTMYSGPSKNFTGILYEDAINITLGSSFTIEYQTKYIPAAFPSGTSTMNWYLRMETYSYYVDSLGNYMTLDSEGNVKNISPTLTRNSLETSKIYVEYDNVNDVYYYEESGKKITFTQRTLAQKSYLPKGTKITMIDLSNDDYPGYYYYICESNATSINLMDFMYIGTNTSINNSDTPTFVSLYHTNQALRVTERLIFVIDFEQATFGIEQFTGNILLEHFYGDNVNGCDIMDYVTSNTVGNNIVYNRAYPSSLEYKVNTDSNETGIDQFDVSFSKENYYDYENAIIEVDVAKDSLWVNTKLTDGSLGIKIEAPTTGKLPDGIEFIYQGVSYYPMNHNEYVIIPINKFGTHQIEVLNILGTIETTTHAEFVATLSYLPTSQYFNEELVSTVDVIDDDIKCSIIEVDRGSMLVELNKHVFEELDTLTVDLTINSNVNPIVQILIYEKTANGGFVPLNYSLGRVNGSGTYSFTIGEKFPPGTYQLVFTNGDLKEVETIVVK